MFRLKGIVGLVLLSGSSILLPSVVAYTNGSYVLPTNNGPYKTSLKIFELVDAKRPDPFNSSHPRRLMVSRFDPVPKDRCGNPYLVSYMPPAVAKTEHDIFAKYNIPNIPFEEYKLEVCPPDNRLETGKNQSWPVAIFSPGLNTTRLLYNGLVQAVASQGFTVLSIDHPYETDAVQFPDGSVIYGGRVEIDLNKTGPLVAALNVRMNDVSFVLDTFGFKYGAGERKAVMFGQSFGGAATAMAMLNDTRIRGGVNIDGRLFGPAVTAGLGRPGLPQSFVLFGAEGHNTSSEESWGPFWRSLEHSHDVDWKREFSIANTAHGSSFDIPLLADIAGVRGKIPEPLSSYIGGLPGIRTVEILARYIPAYFRLALDGKSDDILNKKSESWPEVSILGK